MEDEPFCITNPSRKFYKFLFRVGLDEETLATSMDFIKTWLEQHGYTQKREKIVNMPLQGMFQIRVWLN